MLPRPMTDPKGFLELPIKVECDGRACLRRRLAHPFPDNQVNTEIQTGGKTLNSLLKTRWGIPIVPSFAFEAEKRIPVERVWDLLMLKSVH